MATQGVIARWLTASAVTRQHDRDLAAVDHIGYLAERQVENIGRVQARAMFATMQVNALRLQAERLAPDSAEMLAMIAVAGAVEMTNVITRMNRPGLNRRY